MSTIIYLVILSFAKIGAVEALLYLGGLNEFFCRIWVKFGTSIFVKIGHTFLVDVNEITSTREPRSLMIFYE
jgi:hypothetical protein